MHRTGLLSSLNCLFTLFVCVCVCVRVCVCVCHRFMQLIEEAYQAGIVTVSVVNAHTPLDRITYPILAAEANPNFSHFFLNWLLKVVNLPTPPMPESGAAGEQTEDSANV